MTFRFSLRTLFAVVTLVAVASAYVAHENRIVQERKAIDEWARQIDPLFGGAHAFPRQRDVSWVRRLFGDAGADEFIVPARTSEQQKVRIKAAYPEAELIDDPYVP